MNGESDNLGIADHLVDSAQARARSLGNEEGSYVQERMVRRSFEAHETCIDS